MTYNANGRVCVVVLWNVVYYSRSGILSDNLNFKFTMRSGHAGLGRVIHAFTRLRTLIQPARTDLSKIDIPHPPLYESVRPVGYRYAIPFAISVGAFTCVLVAFSPAPKDLILSTYAKNYLMRRGTELLVSISRNAFITRSTSSI